jgi:hypothetical protein
MAKKIPFINSFEELNTFMNIDTFCQYLKSPLSTSTFISHNSSLRNLNRHIRLNREAMTKPQATKRPQRD